MTAFKKGDQVTLYQRYNNLGALRVTHCVVHSCGKKQMVLTDLTSGEEVGRHFKPVNGEGWTNEWVLPTVDAEATEAKALELAQLSIDREVAHLTRRLEWAQTSDQSEHYIRATSEELALPRAPRIIYKGA